ncbi:hypothetical protein [Enterobacter roggenkampii]|uniref:hypothetical protein n=1 Tax=Enterobacter roggenkampii TaxID=1812935 RepID=UPI0013EFA27B|nr:hypothetical protein [Enterobacter roggenkampii]NHA09407.1 hypothetical protein [Enterobacter roggenkampii]HEO9242457.1 hypothetical protein [Enterobacter ludwigii]
MSNKHHELLGVPKHANQHLLSRLTMEVHTDELRIMASAVESYTDELIAALEAAERRLAELEAKKVTIKLPESFYPDGDIDCPLVINEYQIIEAIVAAGCKPIAVCPRCNCELDLTHKPDGAHYCHPAAAGKGE